MDPPFMCKSMHVWGSDSCLFSELFPSIVWNLVGRKDHWEASPTLVQETDSDDSEDANNAAESGGGGGCKNHEA